MFASTSETTKEVTRLVRAGQARKIGPRLYTTNMSAEPAAVVLRNVWRIATLPVPGAVVAYRTAFEMAPAPSGDLFLLIRDQARALAPALDAEDAFQILDGIIGTLLGTRKAAVSSRVAIARAAGEPYDPRRLELFQTLHAALVQWAVRPRPDVLPTDAEFTNIAFFDAYFSNFIEGTRFKIHEARSIVFEGKIPEARPRDAHDVTGTYALVGNRAAMSRGVRDLTDVETFEGRLKAAHAEVLARRPDRRPGEFKRELNEAGHTTFVDPGDVRGTLRLGFEMTRSLEAPFARAAMLMFVLSEVHPFDDGNGRIARAFMNAELIAGGQRRILIPISFRGEYPTGLRTLSRQAHPDVYLEVLDYAQEYAWRIDFSSYDRALAILTDTQAFNEAEGQSGISAVHDTGRPDVKLRMPPPRQEMSISGAAPVDAANGGVLDRGEEARDDARVRVSARRSRD